MVRTYNSKGANIKRTVFFRLIFGATLALILILTVACSDNEESLKIVIEDSPTAVTPETIDPPDGTPPPPPQAPPVDIAPEPRPAPDVPDVDIPPTTSKPESTPEPSTTTNALTMNPLDVMLKLNDNEDYKRITSNLPVKVAIYGLPQNRAWSVHVMFKKIKLMEIVVDDNTGDVIRRNVQKEHDIKTLAKKMKHGAIKTKRFLKQLKLGYTGALDTALADERFPNIDNTKKITIIVVLGRGGNKPVWHVIHVPGEGKPNTIVTIDDSGSVLSVEEDTKRIKK
jgi:hypothetical protein